MNKIETLKNQAKVEQIAQVVSDRLKADRFEPEAEVDPKEFVKNIIVTVALLVDIASRYDGIANNRSIISKIIFNMLFNSRIYPTAWHDYEEELIDIVIDEMEMYL